MTKRKFQQNPQSCPTKKNRTILNTPHGTHDIPHVHHDIPHGTQDNPHGTHDIPTVLNTPHGAQDIPHCTHDIPQGTEHPHGTTDTLYRVGLVQRLSYGHWEYI